MNKKMSFFQRLLHRWDAKVLSLILAIVVFLFFRVYTLETRSISVPLKVLLDDSYVVASDLPRKVSIEIRGDETLVYSILEEDLTAYADFREYRSEGEFRQPIQLTRKGAALDDALEIRIDPVEITAELEEKMIRSIEVRPLLTGFPSAGFELTNYFVSPTSVSVIGPRSIVEDLKFIYTEEIDISGRYEDFIVSSRLVVPGDGVSFPGGEVVEFKGVVTESIVVNKFTDISIVTVDLPSSLTPADPLPRATITVQGKQLVISQIKPENLNFIADLSRVRRPGIYTVPITLDIPSDLTVLDFSPRELTIEIIEKPDNGNPDG